MTDADLSEDTLTNIALEALRSWDVELESIRLHSHRENVVFKVVSTTGETYALRIHREGYHDLRALESEQAWTDALGTHGIAVPQAIANRANELYTTTAVPVSVSRTDSGSGPMDTRHVGMVRWIAGRTLDEILGQDPSSAEIDSVYETLGRLIAQLHQASAGWPPPAGFQRHAFDAPGLVGDTPFWGPFWQIEAASDAQRQQLIQLRDRLFDQFSALPQDPSLYGMIHADLNANNVLKDGTTMSVIDFDDAGYGWHGFDLAVALWDRMDAVSGREQYAIAHAALVRAYAARRTDCDSSAIVALVPVFLLMRTLMILGWAQARPESGYLELIPGFLDIALDQAQALNFLR